MYLNQLEKVKEQFENAICRQTFMSKDQLDVLLNPLILEMKDHPDMRPEEWISSLVARYYENSARILDGKDIVIPGGSFALDVNHMKVRFQHGYFDSQETKKVAEDTIFDIASISKDFTQTINRYLIREGYYDWDSKVVDLDPEFKSLPSDLTIYDLVSFDVSFKQLGNETNPKGYYTNETTNEDAIRLFKEGISVEKKGNYYYCDQGMMILAEVMKTVTRKSYEELFDLVIAQKFGVSEVYTRLSRPEIERFTGSPNASLGLVNDVKANAFGGVSGHAGVKATANGLVDYMMRRNMTKKIPSDDLVFNSRWGGLMTEKGNPSNRGVFGNWNIANSKGIDGSDSPIGASKYGYTLQGSTRVHSGFDFYDLPFGNSANANAILTNPASLTAEEAMNLEDKINSARKKGAMERGLEFKPIPKILSRFEMKLNGVPTSFIQTDIRFYVPVGKSTDLLINETDALQLQLMFIEQVCKAYEGSNYQVEYCSDPVRRR